MATASSVTKPVVLFDIGDTLFFRKMSQHEADIRALCDIEPTISDTEARDIVHAKSSSHPSLFNNRLGRFASLDEELSFLKTAYGAVVGGETGWSRFIQLRIQYSYVVNPALQKMMLDTDAHVYGIASNGRPGRRLLLEYFSISDKIEPDLILISDEMGCAKPAKQFFEAIIAKCSEYSPNIILVDDEEPNITTARSYGIAAMTPEDFMEQINENS